MPKGKPDRVSLYPLTPEQAIRKAWEAEPENKNGKKKSAPEKAREEQERQEETGEESPS